LKQFLDNRLAELLREEEIKWYQRANVKELLEGDSNTKYFLLIANGKYRKTKNSQLQDEYKIIEGEKELSEHVMNYYRNVFTVPLDNSFTLDEVRLDGISQVSEEESNLLI
jgi:hypothetical protein